MENETNSTDSAANTDFVPAQEQETSTTLSAVEIDRWPSTVTKKAYKQELSFGQASALATQPPHSEEYVRENENTVPIHIYPVMVGGDSVIEDGQLVTQSVGYDPEPATSIEITPQSHLQFADNHLQFMEEQAMKAAVSGVKEQLTFDAKTGEPNFSHLQVDSTGCLPAVADVKKKVDETPAAHALEGGLKRDFLWIAAAATNPNLSVLGTVHRVTPARQAKTDKTKRQHREQSQKAQQAQPKKEPRSFSLRDAKAQDYLHKLLKRNQGEDGEDHINTASAAVTLLGKMLQINAHSPFEHPDLGVFKSLGGLWYFVSSGCEDNAFRSLSGYNCHARGQNVPFREIEGFKYIIAEAAWIKVQQNEELRVYMTDCPLPYKHYTLVGELRVRQTSSIASWYVPILDEIARVLKLSDQDGEQHLPDFSFLENTEELAQKDHKPQYQNKSYYDNYPQHP